MDKKQKIMNLLLIVLLLFFSSLEALVFLYYINDFVNGFTPTDLFGTKIGDTIYGFEAVAADGWAHLVCFPVINCASFFQCLFMLWKLRKKVCGRWPGIIISGIVLVINIGLWFWLLI